MSTLAATNLKHESSASNNIVLDSSGNVGIGTSSPPQLLAVGNSIDQFGAGVSGVVTTAYFGSPSSGSGGIKRIAYDRSTGSLSVIGGTVASPSTQMTVDSSGNVGIGTSSPSAKLHVSGVAILPQVFSGGTANTLELYTGTAFNTSGAAIAIRGSTVGYNNSGMEFYAGGSERARIDSSGNLLVGTTTQSNLALLTIASPASGVSLSAIGRIYSLGTYNNTTASAANLHAASDGHFFRSTSSRKYKRDIQDATFGLSDVLALRPVTYKGNAEADGDTVFGGLIAEEVHTAGLTQFVQYAADGTPDALSYGNMVALCVKAIQELSAKVAALEAKQ